MRSTLALLFLLVAAPVMAQRTTVSASLTGDVTRFSRFDTRGDEFGVNTPRDGEAIGFNVAVGRRIGDHWGVALEAGRTGEIETRHVHSFDIRVAPQAPPVPTTLLPPGRVPPPDFSFESAFELQHTTINALLWVSHDAGERVELSYTGGLTLLRSESENDLNVTDPRLAQWLLPTGLRTIDYRTLPVVGADAAIRLTEHTAVLAGVRAHAVTVAATSGWLIRPSFGVRWRF
ncbi:MAG TPA: outer membrane beta-barrel protein [Vicinamibacterales bacterium]|nr:outer membrane beta-barrel protein [Vicinamibacterales bacterium]